MKVYRNITLLIGLVALSVLQMPATPALADTVIVSVDTADPGSIHSLSVDGVTPQALASSWYQPNAFQGVKISIPFEDIFGGGTFTAYLMNGIGPQATTFNEVTTPTTFTASAGLSSISLWHGLTLDQGQYYLVIGPSNAGSVGGWGATTSPKVTLAPGVMLGDVSGTQFFASSLDVDMTFLPDSNFAIDDLSQGTLMYTAKATEPSTIALFSVGLAGLTLLIRRRSKSQSTEGSL